MTNDTMLGGLYLLMAAMLVFGALMTRREPAAKLFTMALAWVAIFAAGFVLFTFRDNWSWVGQRLKAEAVGTPVQEGRETRMMEAEKKAAALPPKLTVPLIVFFLPVLFIVIISPAIIKIGQTGGFSFMGG